MNADDTIVALATGSLPSGVAILRVSGPMAKDVFGLLGIQHPEARRLSRRCLRDPDDGSFLDDALVVWFPCPGSFTGEDMVELHLHGSRAVVARILLLLTSRSGCRMAEPGEFTRRAFQNGLMDLTEVEALGDLLEADSEAQRRQAIRNLTDGLGKRTAGWRRQVIQVLARLEAVLDFSDEGDVSPDVVSDALTFLEQIAGDVAAALATGATGALVRDGVTIVLAGAPNAGKSALLNRMVNADKAIVSARPGTTRDPIEVRLSDPHTLIRLVDTAGLRDTLDDIEKEGVARARVQIRQADLVLWLCAPDVVADVGTDMAMWLPTDMTDSAPIWWVDTKTDLSASPVAARCGNASGHYAVSSLTGAGVAELTEALRQWARHLTSGEPAVVTRQRHRDKLAVALSALRQGACMLSRGLIELAAEDVRRASQAMAELTGLVGPEDVLDEVFRSFCIGK